jgi:hypothetical protein
MSIGRPLTSAEIREVGEVLYGSPWQGAMARALGVPRQSVSYYLRAGANGSQAAAIIGLVARVAFRERIAASAQRQANDNRELDLHALMQRLEGPLP